MSSDIAVVSADTTSESAADQGDFKQFIDGMVDVMGAVNTRLQRDLTMRNRVSRRFSKREMSELLGVDKTYIDHVARTEDGFPEGERSGREVTFSPAEIMLARAMMGTKTHLKRQHIHWRQPGDPLKVVCVGAQKGGTGKSLTAAHLAQYMHLVYGLRVGVIDSDPQSTISLYFAGEDTPLFDPELRTLADFMGVENPGAPAPTNHSPEELEAMWQPTPWQGIRLLPGGGNILMGDVALFFMSQGNHKKVYRILKDAIERWDSGFGPKTATSDLRNEDGSFNYEAYHRALEETVDVIIIDQQPSITLMQVNGVVSADTLIIPQTMRGFDLSTLTTYADGLSDYMDFIHTYDPELKVGSGGHVVLPTIVQRHDQDLIQIQDMYQRAPDKVLPVWYWRSDAISNAAEQYKSIYEYTPPASRKASARTFLENANAVNDALCRRIFPHLPERGFQEKFIEEAWG